MARRPGLGKITCEACLALDVGRWHRDGHLRPGGSFTWLWNTQTGTTAASLGVTVQAGALVLAYRRHGDPRPVEQRIALTATACHYGGNRPWFRCPSCSHRAGKLYLAGHPAAFACRNCHGLTYATRQEGPKLRGLSRANRLRTKLGGQPGMDAPLPPKPSGMHRSTYARTVEMIRTLEATAEARLA
ncbi:MAG: hypothetical protein NVV74_15890 [Magnetospirillum sp.]|nr:hypothetical protein [Magnetospirillum sp.]